MAYDSISLSLYTDFWFLEIRFSRSSLCTIVMLEGGGGGPYVRICNFCKVILVNLSS